MPWRLSSTARLALSRRAGIRRRHNLSMTRTSNSPATTKGFGQRIGKGLRPPAYHLSTAAQSIS
jgi:hypothetical protein